MSTLIKKFFTTATTILIGFLSNSLAFSQDITVSIQLINPGQGDNFFIVLEIANDDLVDKNLSFLESYADAEGLGKRISKLKLYGVDDREITYKKFAEGEYLATEKIKKAVYFLDADALPDTSANTHVSWIGNDRGLIMLNDLLPQFNSKKLGAKISFHLPPEWKTVPDSASSINREYGNSLERKSNTIITNYALQSVQFDVTDAENAVFLIGKKNWREKEIFVNETKLTFLMLDEWQFEDKLAFEMAEEIVKEYADLFGDIPVKNVQIVLMSFPSQMDIGRWRAETRGANITILSSKAFAESFAKQRLHEQLRHEIFHLWIPNSLNLSGDYAWFYEGFAIYQALKTGVGLGQIRFEDFLNTLEQAYFLDQKRSGASSLIDISNMRWNGEGSSVYAKGMLVAFLCDAAMLDKSRGKRGVKDIFRALYQEYGKKSEKKDANLAILNILEGRNELAPMIEKYIKGAEKIEWAKYLEVFGIEDSGSKKSANLKLKSKLSGRQKALLKKLGYNRPRKFNR